MQFLKELGLHKPDTLAEIQKFIIPKYHKKKVIINKSYYKDFGKIFNSFCEIKSEVKKKEWISKLSDLAFIHSTNFYTKESKLIKPSDVYINDENLLKYFSGYNSVNFVSNDLYTKFNKDKLVKFLMTVGVEDKPRRIEFDPDLSWDFRRKLLGSSGHTRDISEIDYYYEGLENFLQNIDINRSVILWNFLLESIKPLSSWSAEEFFYGEYRWYYYTENGKYFESKFLKILKNRQWLFDRSNDLVKPSNITLKELSDKYKKEAHNLDVLKNVFKFKPDIFDQLPEEDKNKLELVRELSPEEIEEALILLNKKRKEEIKQEESKDDWQPEYKPDEVNINVEEIIPDKLMPPMLEDQVENLTENKFNKVVDESEKQEDIKEPKKDTSKRDKKVGQWGEKYVFISLKNHFSSYGNIEETEYGFNLISNKNERIEVYWLNIKSEIGKGYDFVIKKNDKEVEYLEVKTKSKEEEELIQITGTQWEFARKLYNQGDGDKYWIYAVFNAGKADAKIKKLKNPIKLWKDGKLFAQPIYIRI